MLGWLRRFHVTASLQNDCKTNPSMRIQPGVELATCLFSLLRITGGTDPKPFDTNTCTVTKRPPVRVTESAIRNRHLARERKDPRQLIGHRECCPKAAYLL